MRLLSLIELLIRAQFQQGAETHCSPLAILHGTEPVIQSLHWHKHFYIAALSRIFFSQILSEVNRQSAGLNTWLSLFWSIGVWPGPSGPDLASTNVLAWRIGSDDSFCIALEHVFFFLNCRKYWKNSSHSQGFSTLILQSGLHYWDIQKISRIWKESFLAQLCDTCPTR